MESIILQKRIKPLIAAVNSNTFSELHTINQSLCFLCFLRKPNYISLWFCLLCIWVFQDATTRCGMKNYFLSFLSLKIIQFVCYRVLKLSSSKLCRNKVEWIAKIIQVACSLLLLFIHFILIPHLKLLFRMSFYVPPTCLVLSLSVNVCIVLWSWWFFLLKLQTCHSWELEKKRKPSRPSSNQDENSVGSIK